MIGEWNNGTGRRKSSVARVFLKKGSGKITINGKDIAEYFGRQTSIMISKQPLVLTQHVENFDIQVNLHGGGESGQAGAVRHGIVNLFIFFLAFFLDFFEIAFIILPMLAPVATKLGIDMVWFGVLLCVNMQTAPIGRLSCHVRFTFANHSLVQ